jgi:hypothetical protein
MQHVIPKRRYTFIRLHKVTGPGITQSPSHQSVCLYVYPHIVARQRLGKNPSIVAKQRLGKNPLAVARQRLGKTLLIVARQRLGRNVTAVTNTHATI